MLSEFEIAFAALSGNQPFPWQRALFDRLVAGNFPEAIDLPTGLGKTSVIAVWLLALAEKPQLIPRRLVYVVNRRTVVDQTTAEVKRYREQIEEHPELASLRDRFGPLAISTLRGQFADNREWSADPSRPAVVVGTVDMIGSRLLFSGYGTGFRTRPLYAGLLGQDAIIVHDEAHLEPAFQKLIESIRDEQRRENSALPPSLRLRVMEMSATSRGGSETLSLSTEDEADSRVRQRTNAIKRLKLTEATDIKKLPEEIVSLTLERFSDSGRAVLIFARKVEDVLKIARKLPADRTLPLTGTMRGRERDEMVRHPVFQRFLPESGRDKEIKPAEGTVYLVCTSAGEVGINISADHLICDLSTGFESMAQRLGRVNRFGLREDTEVHVFFPAKLDEKNDPDGRQSKTLALLQELGGDASPSALRRLDADARRAAFSPPPLILQTSDILFDHWAMTTIRDELPGRPKVEPYLHGIREQDPPETHIAWREEVGVNPASASSPFSPEDLVEDYPLKPHELLRDVSRRVFAELRKLAERRPDDPVWVVDDQGAVEPFTLDALTKDGRVNRIEYATVVLSPVSGGLNRGMLDGDSRQPADDVADELFDDDGRRRRARSYDPDSDANTRGMRLVRQIDFESGGEDDNAPSISWSWFERPAGGDSDGSKSAAEPILWEHHVRDVVANVEAMIANLPLATEIKHAIVDAARFHDFGKRRESWQRSIGNPTPATWYAKSGRHWNPREFAPYRHEFGSLFDLIAEEGYKRHEPTTQDLICHLVAAHHGFARPHFPEDCATDWPGHSAEESAALANDAARRFSRLHRRYGRWGLAYLESLLRAADYKASAHPSQAEGER